MHVVQLEKPRLATPLPGLIDKRALFAVAVPHVAPHRRWYALARSVSMLFALLCHRRRNGQRRVGCWGLSGCVFRFRARRAILLLLELLDEEAERPQVHLFE